MNNNFTEEYASPLIDSKSTPQVPPVLYEECKIKDVEMQQNLSYIVTSQLTGFIDNLKKEQGESKVTDREGGTIDEPSS